MRIVACGLIAGAALLGPVPVAMADTSASTTNSGSVTNSATNSDSATSSDGQAVPQAEVSMLAVSLTVGGAIATAASGMALALTRRRALSRPPSPVSG